MTDRFTERHFDLLKHGQGQPHDSSSPQQQQAHDELKEACAVTAAWAQEVQTRLFPSGHVGVRRRPTNQSALTCLTGDGQKRMADSIN